MARTAALVENLKRELRGRNITYATVAKRLGMSEASVKRLFAAGDFSLPMSIHGQVPPGVEVMKERKDVIRFAYAPTAKGGAVRISTRDARALDAVHEFLRFQIEEHQTGDSEGPAS